MRSGLILAAVVAALIFGAADARADLIEADLFIAGDGLLTRDTDTGLEWLDLTVTTSNSVATIAASTWYSVEGFVHATTTQVGLLQVHSADGVTLNTPNDGANYTGVLSLLDLMGTTQTYAHTNGTVTHGGGWAADGPSSGSFYRPYFQTYDYDYNGILDGYLGNPNGYAGGYASTNIGHWLVRSYDAGSPVPEPGSIALLGLGLVGLGFASRRRNARAS